MAESWVLRKAETRAVSLAGHLEYSTAVSWVGRSAPSRVVHLVAMTAVNLAATMAASLAATTAGNLAQLRVVS